MLFNFKNMSNFQRVVLLISTLILFSATIDTDSRATSGLIVIITLIQFIYLLIRVRKLTMFFLFFGLCNSLSLIYCIIY